ncbi:copper resistance CopC family protein [Isoptericola sp. BMS4]|uniref:copper resistance CopC family protein n=1 Tax=Isoptericola sp. BMS4 TaxID=2527875 RepID=UPI0014224038|nr:copper resistance CopC family protein [Isoptericola sp. BMS4]
MNPRPGAVRRHLPDRVTLLATALATAAATMLAVVLPETPAAAHDRLVSADPPDGESLDEPPSELTLTFSGELLGTGAQAAVTTSEGTEPADTEVDGEVVTVTVPDGLSGGEWVVGWRVVSADGHPIEGELTYDVAGAASEEPSPAPSEEPAVEPTAEPTQEASSGAAEPEETASAASGHQHGAPGAELSENGEANWTMSWLFGVAVLAAVGTAAAVLLARRRRDRDLDDEDPDDRPDGHRDGPDA